MREHAGPSKLASGRTTLWISLVATALSGCSLYEAHQSRLDAGREGREAVSAQLQRTQLDYRPFLQVSPVGLSTKVLSTHPKGSIDLFVHYKITETGKTEALDAKSETILRAQSPRTFSSATYPESLPTLFNDTHLRTLSTILKIADAPYIDINARLEYRDYSGQLYRSRFCFAANVPKLRQTNGPLKVEFVDCPRPPQPLSPENTQTDLR
jgi:hypothetical protein